LNIFGVAISKFNHFYVASSKLHFPVRKLSIFVPQFHILIEKNSENKDFQIQTHQNFTFFQLANSKQKSIRFWL
jgi:hypothetical protein